MIGQFLFQKQSSGFPAFSRASDLVMMRPPSYADMDQWISVRARNQARLRPLEPVWAEDALSSAFFNRRLARQVRDWNDDRHYALFIFRVDTGALIGGMNINNVARGAAQFASLGYWIDESVEGRGYMRSALALTKKIAFEDLNLHRLHAATLSHNLRSRRLLEGAGFQEEGFAPRYLEINGMWQDHILFGLVRP